MSRRRSPSSSGRYRAFEATEPRRYDRKVYAGALLLAFIAILLTVGFAVYSTVFSADVENDPPYFDLTSLVPAGGVLPDPSNPAIRLQEHIEALHRKSFRRAYEDLCEGLRKTTTYEEFVSNASENEALFQEIAGYSVPSFEVRGTAASVTGYVNYPAGGRSRASADFAREEDGWKIAIMTLIYE